MLTVRPATLNDAEAICAIQARNGISALSPERWRQFWSTCPFQAQFADVPLGWLLEAEQKPVGVIVNVQMLYEFSGNPIKACIASGWAVDPGYRQGSLKLLNAFQQQKNIDLWLNDSAGPAVAQLLELLKMNRIPASDYDAPLLWPIRTRRFAYAGLRRRGVPAAKLLAFPVGAALGVLDWVSSSDRGRPSQLRRVDCFDGRFDSLWERIRAASSSLRAVRTSSVLQWRFQSELDDGSAVILTHGAEQLQGYAVLARHYREHLGVVVADIMDLQAVGDDPVIIRDLFLGAKYAAREMGAEAVKFAGACGTKRSIAQSLHPYAHRIGHWQLFYKTTRAELIPALQRSESWDFSPFDTF